MRGNENFIADKVFSYKKCGSALLISAKFSMADNENNLNTVLNSVSTSFLSPTKNVNISMETYGKCKKCWF